MSASNINSEIVKQTPEAAVGTSTVSNEVVKQTSERGRLTPRKIVTNEYVLYGVSLIAFFGLWQWTAVSNVLGHASSLATPGEVVAGLADLVNHTLAGKHIWGHMWDSTRRVMIGFVIASLIGIPLGLAMALNPYVRAIVKPIFDMFKPMPPLAWISLAIMWFGIMEAPKIFIITLGAFVPCVLNSYNGIRLIDPELYDVVRVQGGGRWDEIRLVAIPASLPAISSGLQITLSSAWSCVVGAELVSSRSGLGYLIMQGMKMNDPAMVIAGMVVIALISLCFSQGMEWLDRRLCPWQRDIKGL